MINCGGTWCKDIDCVSCYPHHHFTEKENANYNTAEGGPDYIPPKSEVRYNKETEVWTNVPEGYTPNPEFSQYKKWASEDRQRMKQVDPVNHPSHYCNRSMEAIDIIEMCVSVEKNPKVAYNMSNVLKYLLRFRDKGKDLEDLQKARWYLNRMIEKVENEPSQDPF